MKLQLPRNQSSIPESNRKVPQGTAVRRSNVERLFCREKYFLELGNIAGPAEFFIPLEQNHTEKGVESNHERKKSIFGDV
jgi:hypothetical protein